MGAQPADSTLTENGGQSYHDLLNPRWKNKLGIEQGRAEWLQAVVKRMGNQRKGLGLFREIAAKNHIAMRNGMSLLVNLVASGEVPLDLTAYNYRVDTLKRKGAPVNWFVLPPIVASSNAISIARDAPHPAAALLFCEFMLHDGQRIMAKLHYVPTNTHVPSSIHGIKFHLIDPVATYEGHNKWQALFRQTMAGR